MADQQVILITGSSKGIGKYLAAYYSERGFAVVGCSRSPGANAELKNYHHIAADIRVEADVIGMMATIREKFGRLDVAMNNAAINPALSLALMTATSAASDAFNTNVIGTFTVSREAAKLMMRKKFGRIINFSSMAAKHEVSGEAIYSASKAAIHSLTRVMAKELYASGITCNVIAPSALDTDMMSAVQCDALKEVLARGAIPHVGEFADISNTIDWLIRPESKAVTGQIIYMGGV